MSCRKCNKGRGRCQALKIIIIAHTQYARQAASRKELMPLPRPAGPRGAPPRLVYRGDASLRHIYVSSRHIVKRVDAMLRSECQQKYSAASHLI